MPPEGAERRRLGRGPGCEAESGRAASLVGGEGARRAADPSGSREPRQDRPGDAMEGSPIPVLTVPTVPYEDQRPAGGGGLRRPTGLFEGQRNYLPNFIQSVLSSIDLRDRQGCTMVVGSDGRYFSKTATEIVVQMAAANGVSNLADPRFLPRHHQLLSSYPLLPTGSSDPDPGSAVLPGALLQRSATTALHSLPGAPGTAGSELPPPGTSLRATSTKLSSAGHCEPDTLLGTPVTAHVPQLAVFLFMFS